MAAPLHPLLLVATIASVLLALSASPATAATPSKLVQTLCSMKANDEYQKQCTAILNNDVANAATSYLQLLNIIMSVAEKFASEGAMDIATRTEMEKQSGHDQSHLEALKVCENKFKELSETFVITNNLDSERKMTSMYDMKDAINLAQDCNIALIKSSTDAPKIRTACMGVTLMSAIAHHAVALQKGEETGNPKANNREF